MSTSFPFLAIAKAHNVPYGAVLLLSDAIKRAPTMEHLNVWEAEAVLAYRHATHPRLFRDVRNAVAAETQRRIAVWAK